MKRDAPYYCSKCGTLLPRQRVKFAEVEGGWSREPKGLHHARFTGRILCQLCFDGEPHKRRRENRALRALCDDCGSRPVMFRQLFHAYTKLPRGIDVLDPLYSALALCEACWLRRMEGEQLRLFDA